jgi:hypothetical protein
LNFGEAGRQLHPKPTLIVCSTASKVEFWNLVAAIMHAPKHVVCVEAEVCALL